MTQAQRHEEFLEAAKEGGISTVITLIEQGINVNVGNGFDTTALMFSASNGHNNVAQVLINAGATINAANLYGETALSFAVKNNHLGIVKILLQEKANVAITDLQGHSPLKYACQRNHREVAFYLLHAFSEQKIAPNFAHTLVDEYNKIKKDIFTAGWTMYLRMGQPNLKSLEALKDDNLITKTLLSLQPDEFPQDIYRKEIKQIMALMTEIKIKTQKKEKQTEKGRVAPVILSNGHKLKRKRHRKVKAGLSEASEAKSLSSLRPVKLR